MPTTVLAGVILVELIVPSSGALATRVVVVVRLR
jgi:hypothetical protein